MEYISEVEITDKIAEVQKLTEDLDLFVTTFTSYVDEIQELLIGLKVCLNTTGGVARLKDLANIEFDTVSLNSATSSIEDVQISYKKVKKEL